jgi:outer membrane beta-barrel protein
MKVFVFGNWFGAFVLAALSLALPVAAFAADTIEFPEEELASESVLPVFDHPVAVKSRSVSTARRIELGAMGGYSLTEPFFNPVSFGLTGTYHLNEEHGINIFGNFFMEGLNEYGKQLNPIPNAKDNNGNPINANIQYAPAPKYLLLASYQYTGFYGKLSLTKDSVMNLGIYGLLGVGMMGIGDTSKPVVSVGVGQKFYLTKAFALRFDLRFLMYQGPDPVSRALDQKTAVQPANYFEDKMNFSTLVSFGAIFLLPQM